MYNMLSYLYPVTVWRVKHSAALRLFLMCDVAVEGDIKGEAQGSTRLCIPDPSPASAAIEGGRVCSAGSHRRCSRKP